MATMRSTKYPNLIVYDLDVKFRDGVAEVKDRKVITALLKIDGVSEDKDPAGKASATEAPANDGE